MTLSPFSLLKGRLALGLLVSVASFMLASEGNAQDATIQVAYDQPGHSISPLLIGAFFEDINFGADGGFSAELVKNGSFEAPAEMLGWSSVHKVGGTDSDAGANKTRANGAKFSHEREAPVSAANPTFLRLTSTSAESGGVANEGFRGMGVKQGDVYNFSAKCRASAGQKEQLTVRLVSAAGETLAEQSLEIAGSAWHLAEVELKPTVTDAKATLHLLLTSGGSVDIDVVSLCPDDTWMGRPYGMRKDLVQLLADMKPAFFRFPGGCIVEGSQLKYRYQWKTTIGPRDERRMLVNRWNTEFGHRLTPDYYQSFAIGFFEYFQLSEDIGASPVPIINCGMACQFNTGELVPLEELDPYIQDALDLIEFANGPVTSEWGAKRAEMGHPAPFDLRFLGVGNEQWGPEYFERYEVFAKVLQEKHPEIELISTSGPFPSGKRFDYAWPMLRNLKVPVVDEHCYAMPDWFLREATRYDSYDREGPKIFMGEYAAHSAQIGSTENRNNLRCAVAEAAFLSGIERNSDVVTMSSYAPLMGHEEAWQWRPNLLWFDNLSSYGTPSYYVQKLYSDHRGDVTVPVELTDHRAAKQPGGRIGFGVNRTSVEYKDLKVTNDDDVLFGSESLKSIDEITRIGGDWKLEEGVLRQVNQRTSGRVILGDDSWNDCTINFQAKKLAGREGFTVYFRIGSGGSRIEWSIGGRGNSKNMLVGHMATHSDTPIRIATEDGKVESGRWYDIQVELKGSQIKCFIDDKLVHDVNVPDPSIARLFAVASIDRKAGEIILKVINPTDNPTKTKLALKGIAAGPQVGRLITMTGDPADENTIAEPLHTIPVETKIEVAGNEFEHSFPAHSVSVIRLKSK